MKISQLKNELQKNPAAHLRFALPNGDTIPAHAHVTEVARVDKRFVDCGGTLRNDSQCRLQTWFAGDVDHRLTAGKLGKILEMAAPVLGAEDLEVDVEHEVGFISQFPLDSVAHSANEITLRLTERHTACLALDKCQPPQPARSPLNPMRFDFRPEPTATKCCSEK